MSSKTARQVRRTGRRAVHKNKVGALGDFCKFVNAQKLGRRIKLALLVIAGNISPEKMNQF